MGDEVRSRSLSPDNHFHRFQVAAPRMIQQSDRPRVSDRTMVGNSATNPLGDAGVVTYIQPRLIPHLIRGVIGLVALARRTSLRRCQPQLLVPTRRFHEVSGARRRSVPKLRKLSVGSSANHDPI
jgi:hypothetical protein